jgi:hypothetical protein
MNLKMSSTKNDSIVSKLMRNAVRLNNYAVKIHGSSDSRRDVKKMQDAHLGYTKSISVLFKLLSRDHTLPSFRDLKTPRKDVGLGQHMPQAAKRISRPIVIQLDNLQQEQENHHDRGVTMLQLCMVVLYNLGLFYDQVLNEMARAETMFRSLLRLRKYTYQSRGKENNKLSSQNSILFESGVDVSMLICFELAMFYSRNLQFEEAIQLHDEAFVCSLLSSEHGTVSAVDDRSSSGHLYLDSEIWADAEASHALGELDGAVPLFRTATQTLGAILDSNIDSSSYLFTR